MTGMMVRYLIKLVIRVGIFVAVLVFYILDKPAMCKVMTMNVYKGIRPIHILWLFFTSCIVLIRWEVVYAKHPERFWYGSNKNLQCVNCKDKTCRIKNHIMGRMTEE